MLYICNGEPDRGRTIEATYKKLSVEIMEVQYLDQILSIRMASTKLFYSNIVARVPSLLSKNPNRVSHLKQYVVYPDHYLQNVNKYPPRTQIIPRTPPPHLHTC